MTTRAQKAALKHIKSLERKVRGMCEKTEPDENRPYCRDVYQHRMPTIEDGMTEALIEVEELVKTHALGDKLYIRLKNRVVDYLYKTAMHRKDFAWAAEFAKKYEL